MSTETVDEIINGIIASISSTKTSVDDLVKSIKEDQYPQLIQSLLQKVGNDSVEGVSLLALKNNSLISYLNNVVLVILSHLERLEEDGVDEELRTAAIQRSIVQRVNLEKGVKPLEKKLNYQLDKMVRAFARTEADEEKVQKKITDKANRIENGDEEQDDEDDDSSSSEEEDDNLSYKPDAAALAKLTSKSDTTKDRKGTSSSKPEGYKPPKISALAPPTANKEEKEKGGRNRKLQSMEEYLREQSDMPTSEASIGSTIVDHGRGGVKTQHDRRKEQEIQNYEESNFIRLSANQLKKSFKEKQRDAENQFGGEDWSMFNNNSRNIETDTSRKRKPNSVWDRVKKRRS